MITISLDEKGIFEQNASGAGEIVFVAGIIYDDGGDPGEAEREKSRVRKYFERVCREAGTVYPFDLHYGRKADGSGYNGAEVGRTKILYMKTLGDFLREGRFGKTVIKSSDGRARSGRYYTYAIVRSPEGKSELSAAGISNLVDEQLASNLYIHMVEDAVSRILFYNETFSDVRHAALDLATRVFISDSAEDVGDYADIGYKHDTLTNSDGSVRQRVFLTNQDVYRTALEREMLLSGNHGVKIEPLQVRSIRYDPKYADDGMEFLYLADAICTCLGHNARYGERYLEKVAGKMQSLTGDDYLLFCYDDADTYFTEAWRYAGDGDAFRALDKLYSAVSGGSAEADFYKSSWADHLVFRLLRTTGPEEFDSAVRQLSRMLKSNRLNQDRAVFIFRQLDRIAGSAAGADAGGEGSAAGPGTDAELGASLYELYDSGISACNHVGDQEGAAYCAEKVRQYIQYAGVERVIRSRHRYCVSKCEAFEYMQALATAQESYDFYEASYEIQKSLLGDVADHIALEYGVAASQLGQVCSYIKDPRAGDLFRKALSLMEEGSPDWYITGSYYLHYLIDSGDEEGYRSFAREYYGADDLTEQLERIIRMSTEGARPLMNFKYAVYLYLKAVYVFRLGGIADAVLELMPEEAACRNGHPWELSYKYLSMIMFRENRYVASKLYAGRLDDFLREGAGETLEAVTLLAQAEVALLRSPNVDVTDKLVRVRDIIIRDNEEITELEPTLEAIGKVMTYTYR